MTRALPRGVADELSDVAFRFTDRKSHEPRRIELADVLAIPGALRSLICGKPHAFTAGWIEARRIINADASHDHGAIGGMLPMRDLTHVTVGGRFVASVPGHLTDGEVWFSGSEAVAYRVRLVSSASVGRAA